MAKKRVRRVKEAPRATTEIILRTSEESKKLQAKGKCTNCAKRKAQVPFLWCNTCTKDAP